MMTISTAYAAEAGGSAGSGRAAGGSSGSAGASASGPTGGSMGSGTVGLGQPGANSARGDSTGALGALPRPIIEETEIRPFAAVVQDVQRITDFYSPLAAAARTPEELDRVESAAFDEMKEAVTKKGFAVSRFNQIVAMARLDPDLADRITAHLPQRQLEFTRLRGRLAARNPSGF